MEAIERADAAAAGGPAPGHAAPGRGLEEALDAIRPLDGTGFGDGIRRALEECRRIWRFGLAPGAAPPEGAPLLVAIAGGTNAGKTSVLNAVAGAEVVRPSELASRTKAVTVHAHRARADDFRRAGFLHGYERGPLASPDDPDEERNAGRILIAPHERDEMAAAALADSPDIDAKRPENHRVAHDLLYAADAVLFVASPEKYNDRDCVAFLERALRQGKATVAVFNKDDAPEAAADFRERVVPGAARRAGADAAGVRVLSLPYVPGRRPIPPEAAEPIREALRALAAGAAAVRARSRAGAARALEDEAAPALEWLRREAEGLAAYRGDVRNAAAGAAAEYAAELRALPLLELDRVFRLLAAKFRVPVIDDAYDGLRGAARPVTDFVREKLGFRPRTEERLARHLEERDRRDLEAAALALGRALEAVRALPDRTGADLSGALRAAMVPPSAAGPLFDLGPAIEPLSAAAARWADGLRADLERRLSERPALLATGRAAKTAVRALATGAAVLAGGLHLGDLLVAPIVDLFVSLGVQQLIDRAALARSRDGFHAERAAVFERLAIERTDRLALGSVRGGATAEAVARLGAAVAAAAAGGRP